MKRNYNFLIALIFVLIILATLDLVTGIFYWNRTYLSFDPATFNNLFSPLASVCASTIYGITLYYIVKQTKIFRSQSIKPHFENEIQILKGKFEGIEMFTYSSGNAKVLAPSSIIVELSNSFNLLMLNPDFISIQEKFKNGEAVSDNQIEDSSFFSELYLLLGLTKFPNNYELFYDSIFNFINEVILSTMTKDDKIFIIRKVINTFFSEDLLLLNNILSKRLTEIVIPILYANVEENISTIKLSDTNFFKNIVRIKNILQQYTPELKE